MGCLAVTKKRWKARGGSKGRAPAAGSRGQVHRREGVELYRDKTTGTLMSRKPDHGAERLALRGGGVVTGLRVETFEDGSVQKCIGAWSVTPGAWELLIYEGWLDVWDWEKPRRLGQPRPPTLAPGEPADHLTRWWKARSRPEARRWALRWAPFAGPCCAWPRARDSAKRRRAAAEAFRTLCRQAGVVGRTVGGYGSGVGGLPSMSASQAAKQGLLRQRACKLPLGAFEILLEVLGMDMMPPVERIPVFFRALDSYADLLKLA